MLYSSTRGGTSTRYLRDLLSCGTASDGGLFAPVSWPEIHYDELETISRKPYSLIASDILALFGGSEWPRSNFDNAIQSGLDQFDQNNGPPLEHLSGPLWSMELFHGPTLAFKDYALAPLAELLDEELVRSSKRATVLCATSGDTGAATASAFAGRKQVDAVILFPEGRVSDVQRKQMTSLDAANVLALCVKGDFDDCQRIVKDLYQSEAATRYRYTAVNSINIVRILLQVSYYIQSSFKVFRDTGEPVNFAIPTGNFGNVFAAYIAKTIGAPIAKLIVTSNDNDVLPRLLNSGRMSKADTIATLSPSMDIQVSSNFERMLWLLKGRDGKMTDLLQSELATTQTYDLAKAELAALMADFDAVRCSQADALATMRRINQTCGKVICPHSATAYHAADFLKSKLNGPIVVAETAHPAKFPTAIKEALGVSPDVPQRLSQMAKRKEEFQVVEATVGAVQMAIDQRFSEQRSR